jgi:hypothetical protein
MPRKPKVTETPAQTPWENGGISGVVPPDGLTEAVNQQTTAEKLIASVQRRAMFTRRRKP